MELNKESREAVLKAAIRLLSRRTHTRRELSQKLYQRKFSKFQVEFALEKAVANKWLDDELACRQLIEEQVRRGGHGRRWIEKKLGEKGIEQQISTTLLNELIPEDLETDLAEEFVKNWLKKQKNYKLLINNETSSEIQLSLNKDLKIRCYRAAVNRGFSSNVIDKVLSRFMEPE